VTVEWNLHDAAITRMPQPSVRVTRPPLDARSAAGHGADARTLAWGFDPADKPLAIDELAAARPPSSRCRLRRAPRFSASQSARRCRSPNDEPGNFDSRVRSGEQARRRRRRNAINSGQHNKRSGSSPDRGLFTVLYRRDVSMIRHSKTSQARHEPRSRNRLTTRSLRDDEIRATRMQTTAGDNPLRFDCVQAGGPHV